MCRFVQTVNSDGESVVYQLPEFVKLSKVNFSEVSDIKDIIPSFPVYDDGRLIPKKSVDVVGSHAWIAAMVQKPESTIKKYLLRMERNGELNRKWVQTTPTTKCYSYFLSKFSPEEKQIMGKTEDFYNIIYWKLPSENPDDTSDEKYGIGRIHPLLKSIGFQYGYDEIKNMMEVLYKMGVVDRRLCFVGKSPFQTYWSKKTPEEFSKMLTKYYLGSD